MKEQTNNTCQFCGQVLLGGQECDCADAVIHRAKKSAYDEAINEIKELVTNWPDEHIKVVESAADEIIFNGLKSAQFEDLYGVKLKLSFAPKSYIKIDKTKTSKSSITI